MVVNMTLYKFTPKEHLSVCVYVCAYVHQLCGCSLVVLGLYLHADRQSSIYLDLLQSIPVSGPLLITGHLAKVLVVMGLIVSTLSFLGCCGACVDSACFLCLVSITILQAALCRYHTDQSERGNSK